MEEMKKPKEDDGSSEINQDANIQTELDQPDLDVDEKVSAADSQPSVVAPGRKSLA